MIRALVFVIAGFLCACSTSNIRDSYELTAKSASGVVTGSITRDGRYSEYLIRYRQIPDGESGYFSIGQDMIIVPYFPKGDFDDPHAKGELFAAELPAGQYEFYVWGIRSGMIKVGPTEFFSIKFRVEPGQAIYIGNIHFTQAANSGLAVTGAKVSYLDKSARDIPLLGARFPALAHVAVASVISPDTEQYNLGGSYASHSTNVPVFIQAH